MINIIILKILGIVILCILLIIAIVLMFPVKILAFTSPEKKLQLLYKWLFFTFGKSPNPKSPIIKFAKRVTGISNFEKVENIQKNIEIHGLEQTIKDILRVVSSILSEVKYLLPKCTVRKLSLKIICADKDAAVTGISYGGICAVVYPAIGAFYSFTKQEENCTNIQITCDFNSQEPDLSIDGIISCTALFALVAFLKLAFKNYKYKHQAE